MIIPQSMFLLLLFWNNSKDHFLFKAIHFSAKHNSGPLLVKIFNFILQHFPSCIVSCFFTNIVMSCFFIKIVMCKINDLVKRSALRFDSNEARSKQSLCREFQDISRTISTSINWLKLLKMATWMGPTLARSKWGGETGYLAGTMSMSSLVAPH